jgi:hypothetical protein
MLVEFERTVVDENEQPSIITISINPQYVAAVLMARDGLDESAIIRLGDGRGFVVRGSYADVSAKLSPH